MLDSIMPTAPPSGSSAGATSNFRLAPEVNLRDEQSFSNAAKYSALSLFRLLESCPNRAQSSQPITLGGSYAFQTIPVCAQRGIASGHLCLCAGHIRRRFKRHGPEEMAAGRQGRR